MAVDISGVTFGTVYFVQQGGGPIKIGKTGNLMRRLRVLQSGSPVPLRVIWEITIDRDHMGPLERRLHLHFHEERIGSSEWFHASRRLLAFIAADEAWPPPLPV